MNISKKVVTDSARSWLGTPFKLQGRIKGKGCDCLGLIMEISKELKIKNKNGILLCDFDQTNYSLTIDNGTLLENFLDNNLNAKSFYESGDLILLSYNANPQHLAIVVSYLDVKLSIIHADITSKRVVENILNEHLIKKIKKIYQFA